jgi:putative ATP-binding cassette transporter
MEFVRFFQTESTRPLRKMTVMAVVAGAANGAILAVINSAAESAMNREVSFRYFAMFVVALLTFIYTKKYAMSEATLIVEQAIERVRLRIAGKIRRTELSFIEHLGFAQLFTTVAHDTNVISQAAVVLIGAAASCTMLIASLAYVAYLSLPAFLITLVSVALGTTLYLSHRRELLSDYHRSTEMEGRFVDALSHVLQGFKQLKTNRRRSDAVFENLVSISHETEWIKIRTGLRSTTDYIFSQTFYYSLIAVIVFLMPIIIQTHALVVIKLTAAILFIVGPLDLIVGSFPLLARSTVAIQNLRGIEAKLDLVSGNEATVEMEAAALTGAFKNFETLQLADVVFNYREGDGHSSFTVGPVNLSLRKGEIVFLVGGNGSGKSTLLKLLTGLYPPEAGSLLVDGRPVLRSELSDYRELFGVIFGDFHLFDRLYGIDESRHAEVDALLSQMQIATKTRFEGGKFTNLDLSTGQRKRLAMIAALLEDKPIYIFDEWAADQDPQFKDYFYTQLLQSLKNQGRTVIAVTHDDRYFAVADRVLKMEFGKL